MKTRIFSVLGLLVLCATLSTLGSQAWAQPVSSVFSLQGNYSCTGTGTDFDGDIPFDSSGVLFATSGNTLVSPMGSLWVFDIAGFGVTNVFVENGTWEAGPNGQGIVTLTFSGPFIPVGIFSPFPLTFTYNMVMDSFDANGVAHEFTLILNPPTDITFLVLVHVCRLQ